MFKARIKITITTFRTTNGKFGPDQPEGSYIDAHLSDLQDISARPAVPSVFTLVRQGDDDVLKIKIPKGYHNGATVLYQLPDPNYVVLGIAFSIPDIDRHDVGREVFPLIEINRDSDTSEMSIIDMCDEIPGRSRAFTYGILIQKVETGEIGIYDPTIINDPPEPQCPKPSAPKSRARKRK